MAFFFSFYVDRIEGSSESEKSPLTDFRVDIVITFPYINIR
jgi:hypothetical protein